MRNVTDKTNNFKYLYKILRFEIKTLECYVFKKYRDFGLITIAKVNSKKKL